MIGGEGGIRSRGGWELLGDSADEIQEGYDSGWDFVLGRYIEHTTR